MIKKLVLLMFFCQITMAQLDTLWTKTYEEELDSISLWGHSIQSTTDGGFVVLGQKSETDLSTIYLMKANSDGEFLWIKTLPHQTYEFVSAYSIDETSDNGLVVLTMESNFSCTGSADSTSKTILILFRLASNGDTLWTRSYIQDYINYDDLCQYRDFKSLVLQDGNLLLFGCFYLHGEKKTWLIKTDSDGNIMWENNYDINDMLDIIESQDGNLFFTGGYGSWGMPTTAYVGKIDTNGNLEWIVDEMESYSTRGEKIHSTLDNGIIVGGQYSSEYYTGSWIWKTDSLGNTEWTSLDIPFINLVQHADSTYIVAGNAIQYGLLYSLINSSGDVTDGIGVGLGSAYDITTLATNTQVTLCSYWPDYNYDSPSIRIVKTVYDSPLVVEPTLIEQTFSLLSSYPNPFNPTTTIRYDIGVGTANLLSLRIYDITGRVVDVLVNGEQNPGHHEIQWNASQHASGIYFVELVAGDKRDIQKLILLK